MPACQNSLRDHRMQADSNKPEADRRDGEFIQTIRMIAWLELLPVLGVVCFLLRRTVSKQALMYIFALGFVIFYFSARVLLAPKLRGHPIRLIRSVGAVLISAQVLLWVGN